MGTRINVWISEPALIAQLQAADQPPARVVAAALAAYFGATAAAVVEDGRPLELMHNERAPRIQYRRATPNDTALATCPICDVVFERARRGQRFCERKRLSARGGPATHRCGKYHTYARKVLLKAGKPATDDAVVTLARAMHRYRQERRRS